MTETILPLLASLFAGAFVWLFARKKKSAPEQNSPPKNTAADVSRDNIQQTFEEEVGRVKKATKGEDPAGDLADLGNARKR